LENGLEQLLGTVFNPSSRFPLASAAANRYQREKKKANGMPGESAQDN
jgi:hypothetical protein